MKEKKESDSRLYSWKDNVSFILVEPKEPGNIGASARAMKNMGFKTLELVNPVAFLTEEARQMACNDAGVLDAAKVHADVRDAIRDKKLVVGTTRRLGSRRGLVLSLKDSVKKIITTAKGNRVAILFGRERNGLTNEEVAECGVLMKIPSDFASPSLNLAQSVLLVAYELSQKTYKMEPPALVKREELEDLYQHIDSTLKLLEYTPRGNRDIEKEIMKNLKHLIGRAGLTDWELHMLHGLCAQAQKRAKQDS